uniref:Trout C-polysaccharide binding protein 1, isoform 2 n=1 Tax=Oncorhynchus mykiss TaxID=8022 RepID=A0A1C4HDV1_ONCMY|nr:trout C-polysaccharide binding protein 1, isoform 2 [Oncorhynchus mykiss]
MTLAGPDEDNDEEDEEDDASSPADCDRLSVLWTGR